MVVKVHWSYPPVLVQMLILVIVLTIYIKKKFRYWKGRNIPFLEPWIPFGTTEHPFAKKYYIGIHLKMHYDKLKAAGHKHGGFYVLTIPHYIPITPEMIQHVIQRDFQYFTERGFYYNEKDDPLSANLFALGGAKWRLLRTKLSPAFTSRKMRIMFEPLVQCAHQMRSSVEKLCKGGQAIDAKEMMACYTTDVIGSCAFGFECNSFTNPNAEFRQHGKKTFQFTSLLRLAKITFAFCCPDFARWLRIRLFDKESTDFFIAAVKNAVEFRKTHNVARKDMLQLLMDLESDNLKNHTITIKELTAQVFIFFAAGFETSSTTLTFCLYELARNPTIQQRLRNEIKTVLARHEEEITYDAIMEMKYMAQIIDETLRKYPPVSFITRQCVKDYIIPGTNTILEKGTDTVISILGLHHDPEYYPNPDKFDPERFSNENNSQRVPFTYLPFGEGPRICIGLRFGLMQIKVGLAVLLRNYRFSLNKTTTVPLEFVRYSFTLLPQTDVLLDVEKVIA